MRQHVVDEKPVQAPVAIHEGVQVDKAERGRCRLDQYIGTAVVIINIDVMLAKRKMSVTELAEKVGITMANISVLKNGKAKAIRFSTLEAICMALDCQPGDILEFKQAATDGLAPSTSRFKVGRSAG